MYVELARATNRCSSPAVMLASTNATVDPPEITSAAHVSTAPGGTGVRKLIFISALAANTLRPCTKVTAAPKNCGTCASRRCG